MTLNVHTCSCTYFDSFGFSLEESPSRFHLLVQESWRSAVAIATGYIGCHAEVAQKDSSCSGVTFSFDIQINEGSLTEEKVCSCFYRSFEIDRDFSVFLCAVRGRAAEVHKAGVTQRAPELDPALIQQLRDRCDEQARQLQSLQAQFNRTSLCLDVFSITTQHFCHKVRMLSLSPRVEEL